MLSFVIGGLTGGLLWVIAMTRLLGPERFGILGPVFNSFWLLCVVLSLGIPQSLMTFISHHFQAEREESLAFAREGSVATLWLAAAVMAIGFVLLLWGSLGGLSFFSGSLWFVVLLGASLNLLYWGLDAVLKGLQRLDLSSIGQLVFPLGLFLGSLLGVMLMSHFSRNREMAVVGGALGMAVGSLLAYLVCYAFLRRLYPYLFPLYRAQKMEKISTILTFGGLSAVCLTMFNVLVQLTPVFVGFFASRGFFAATVKENLKISGYFATANMYGQGAMLMMGLTFALLPAISEAHREENKPLMQRYYHLSMKIALAIIVPLTFIYLIFGGKIVELFSGAAFQAAEIAPYIGLIGIGFGSFAIIYLLINLYMGLKDLKPPFLALSLALLAHPLGVAVSALFLHSALAIAVVVALVPALTAVFLLWYTYWKYGLAILSRDLFLPVGSCLGALLGGGVALSLQAPLFLLALLALLGYLLPGVLFGFVSEEDALFLLTFFKSSKSRLPTLLKYARGVRLWGKPVQS